MKKGIRKGFFLHCHLINLTKREIPVKLHMTVGILLAAASAFLQAPRDLRSPRIAARIASPLATVDVTFEAAAFASAAGSNPPAGSNSRALPLSAECTLD